MEIEKARNSFTIYWSHYCINIHWFGKYWNKPKYQYYENGGRKKN